MREKTVEEDLYERLKMGYDLLLDDDRCLNDCFLYFAAFPEDSKILFEDIVWGWIGEGLVPDNGEDDPSTNAYDLLDMLWRRSFIESNVDVHDDEDDLWFKMHDVMRDLAFYIVKKDCGEPPAKKVYINQAATNLEKVPEECTTIPTARRLLMSGNKLKTLPANFCAPMLISLILQNNPIVSLPPSCWINFPELRVLDLSQGRFNSLPEEISNLKHLVSLNLSNNKLQSLPNSIGLLSALKFLNLISCRRLSYLPSGITHLSSLQELLLDDCEGLIWSEHSKLEMIEAVDRACLFCLGCLGSNDAVRASLEDISTIISLTKLTICGLPKVEIELPHNLSSLTKLTDLRLYVPLKAIPADMSFWFNELRTLHIWGGTNLKYFPTSFTQPGAFPTLINLFINTPWLIQFPRWYENSLPQLRKLHFNGVSPLRVMSTMFLPNAVHYSSRFKPDISVRSSIWRNFTKKKHNGEIDVFGADWDELEEEI